MVQAVRIPDGSFQRNRSGIAVGDQLLVHDRTVAVFEDDRVLSQRGHITGGVGLVLCGCHQTAVPANKAVGMGGGSGLAGRCGGSGHFTLVQNLPGQDCAVIVDKGDGVLSRSCGVLGHIGGITGDLGHSGRPAGEGVGYTVAHLYGISRSCGGLSVFQCLRLQHRAIIVFEGDGIGSYGGGVGSHIFPIRRCRLEGRRPAGEGIGVFGICRMDRISRGSGDLSLRTGLPGDQLAIVIAEGDEILRGGDLHGFIDLNVVICAVQGVSGVAQIVKGEVPAADPIGGGVLIGQAREDIVHRSQLLAVHTEVDHVGAAGDLVGQAVGVLLGDVDVVIRQINAIVAVLGAVIVTHGDQSVAVAEQIGGVGVVAALCRGQQEGAAGETALCLPFHAPGTVMQQLHCLVQTECAVGIGGSGERAVINGGIVVACGTDQIAVAGGPAVAVGGGRGGAVGPDLQIVQLAIRQRVHIRADIAEGEVLAADPVGGGSLGHRTQIIVIQSAQLLAVHAEVDHVGAAGDLVGQAVGMLGCAVNAVAGQAETVVVVSRAVVVAQADESAVGRPQQVGRIGVDSGNGGGQQQRAAGEGAGGFPLHHPGRIMLQHHGAAQIEQTVGNHIVGEGAMELGGIVEGAAVVGFADELVVHRLPAEVRRTGGAHGRIIHIVQKVAAGIVVGIVVGFAPVGVEVQLAGFLADCHILDLKQRGISAADDTEGQGRIVSQLAISALQVVDQNHAGVHLRVARQGNEQLAVMVIHALLQVGGEVIHLSLNTGGRNVDAAQEGQIDHTAGDLGVQRTGVEISAGLDDHLHMLLAGMHDLHGGHADGGAVVTGGVSAGGGGCGAADLQPHQR